MVVVVVGPVGLVLPNEAGVVSFEDFLAFMVDHYSSHSLLPANSSYTGF